MRNRAIEDREIGLRGGGGVCQDRAMQSRPRLTPVMSAPRHRRRARRLWWERSRERESVIEGELAEKIDLGDLEAQCNEPEDLVEDETFTCTTTTSDGQTIEFIGTMTSDDEFNINTSNLLVPSDITTIVAACRPR